MLTISPIRYWLISSAAHALALSTFFFQASPITAVNTWHEVQIIEKTSSGPKKRNPSPQATTQNYEKKPTPINETQESTSQGSNLAPTQASLLTELPSVLKEVKIDYPETARRAGIEGVVELAVVIDENGKVATVKVKRGLGLGLDEVAQEALKGFVFKPGRQGSRAVATEILYKYRFQLLR